MSYFGHLEREARENNYFRKVLFTGDKSQLVVMDIKPGEDVGEETHQNVEQVLFFVSGQGKAVLNGQEREVSAGDVVVVSPGTRHNFLNTGNDSLKIYTVYAPPNHIDGRVHQSKADAEADVEDEEFGHAAR